MLNMSSQDTRRKVRLNEKVESRVRGDLYARFGGEYLETYYCKKWQGAGCLAYGQIASAKIPLSRMISPALYWVMTGDDFSLDINNPNDPKVLVVGNNPDRQNIYSAALGLYNSRIVKLINKKKQLKSSVDRKSTRLNSSHANISYAVFCLKKKKKNIHELLKYLMSTTNANNN